MTKRNHHQVCKPRYNPGQETRGQTFTEWPLCAHVRASFSPETPQRRRECGAPTQFGQSHLKHGKKKKKQTWICDLRSNYSKLFPVLQPKASAWKQSWKCPGFVSGYKRVMKPLSTGLPRAQLLQAWHTLCPGSRSWVKLLQEVRNKSKGPEAQTSQCWCHFWGGHNPDPHHEGSWVSPVWAGAEGGASTAPTSRGNPSRAAAAMAGSGQCWSHRGQRARGDAWQQHILLQCTPSLDTTCCHHCLSHVPLGTVLWGTGPFNAKPPDFCSFKAFVKDIFVFQCPILLFFACISPQLPPNPVLVKQGWRYFGHVFTLLMYTCLVSFHFPSDYTLLHKCSHLAQHRSFFSVDTWVITALFLSFCFHF